MNLQFFFNNIIVIVVIIIWKFLLTTPHHSALAKLSKWTSSFSARKTKKLANIRPRKPMYNVVMSSCNTLKTILKEPSLLFFNVIYHIFSFIFSFFLVHQFRDNIFFFVNIILFIIWREFKEIIKLNFRYDNFRFEYINKDVFPSQ